MTRLGITTGTPGRTGANARLALLRRFVEGPLHGGQQVFEDAARAQTDLRADLSKLKRLDKKKIVDGHGQSPLEQMSIIMIRT